MIIPYKEIKLAVVLIVRDVKFTNRIMYIQSLIPVSPKHYDHPLRPDLQPQSLSSYNNEYRRI